MKKSTALATIIFLLILLFMYTGVSKLIAYDNFTRILRQTNELRPFASILAILIPGVELIISALLMIEKTRKWGLYASFGLMFTFTLYVVYIIYLADHWPCACGGIFRGLTWKQHLLFNSSYTILAAIGIFLHKNNMPLYEKNTTPKFL